MLNLNAFQKAFPRDEKNASPRTPAPPPAGTVARMTKAVLWDLDGTLVDSEQYHWLAWCDTMAAEDIALTHEQYWRFQTLSSCFLDVIKALPEADVVGQCNLGITTIDWSTSE